MVGATTLVGIFDRGRAMAGYRTGLRRAAQWALLGGRIIAARLYNWLPTEPYLKGAYVSYEAAMASRRDGRMAGYDHPELMTAEHVNRMSVILSWDYAILFWLDRLLPLVDRLIDAGGHVGTKYRAFRSVLEIKPDFEWIILEIPSAVEQGRLLAEREGLDSLRFETEACETPPADLLLASGLLQYYPGEFSVLLRQLPKLPTHVLVNKVAVRSGRAVFTMQKIGPSRVPYQIRDRQAFLDDVRSLGYEIVHEWDIPQLAHTIPTHPELGASQSAGFYFRRTGASAPTPDPRLKAESAGWFRVD
ncbi:MAG: methyltransferase, TIGR04325 family [Caulobacterales bacterium]|jgi:putative methyltransferase (TIGR04325 family)|nr:methyltransferase, TIGR04325 family [Caulobacterales bacterium]